MSAPKSPPPRIDGFTHVEGIGGGGFADVFLFTQHSTGRGVAVKVLRAEHLSDASLRQFETEARVMAGVSTHPYIVTIHDAGIATDGRPYLVMEHYPQPHFGRRAAGGHLPLSEVLRVGVQVCSAVETAHRAGILHRDIKPANILTSAYGDPGLTDFGIAGVQTDEGMSSAAGVSYGFAAPEVVLDEQATGSVSSDVYALGATLYALLSGRSPVYVPGGDNSTATLARRVASGEVQPLGRDDLPPSLRHLLAATLTSIPDARPARAAELAAALRDIEQELRLPPTPLVLTGAGPTGMPLAPTRPAGDDATRRPPKVVHAHGKPEPVSAPAPAPATPAFTTPRPPSAPSGLGPGITGTPVTTDEGGVPASAFQPAPADSRRGVSDDHTVARPRPASGDRSGSTAFAPPDVVAPASAVQVSPDRTADVGRARALIGVGLAVLATIAIAAAVLSRGGDTNDDDRWSSPGSTVAVGPAGSVDPPEGGGPMMSPRISIFEIADDGTVDLQWTAPLDADGPVTYEVHRSDSGRQDDEPSAETSATKTTIPGPLWQASPPLDGELCFTVRAVSGASSSTDDMCHPIAAAEIDIPGA